MISLLLAAAAFTSSPMPTQTYDFRDALDAIRIVETGGEPNEGIGSRGDGGNARGPYQIHRIYHVDAAGEDKSLGDYSLTLTSKSYSERVVRAYMSRYASGRSAEAGARSGVAEGCGDDRSHPQRRTTGAQETGHLGLLGQG